MSLGHSAPSRELTPGLSPRAPPGLPGVLPATGPDLQCHLPWLSPSPSRPLQPRRPATGKERLSAFPNAAPWSGQMRGDPRPVPDAGRRLPPAEVPEEEEEGPETSPGPDSPDTPLTGARRDPDPGRHGAREPGKAQQRDGGTPRGEHGGTRTDAGRGGQGQTALRDGGRAVGKRRLISTCKRQVARRPSSPLTDGGTETRR